MSQDNQLRTRARAVIPGGLWGHMRADGLPKGYPQFFRSGDGCRITDVDGRSYLDFMCSWGPIVLGHHHPEVEAAADRQRALGDALNGPGEVLVQLAERLTGLVTHADWAMFSKNGTDATTTCVSIARAATGRRKILLARKAYHGALPWCSPYPLGSTAEDRAHLIPFDFNDLGSLQQAVEHALTEHEADAMSLLQPQAQTLTTEMAIALCQQLAQNPERLPEPIRVLFAATDWRAPKKLSHAEETSH